MATIQLVTAAKRAVDYLNELSTGNRRFGSMYQDISVGRQLRDALETVDAPLDTSEHACHAIIEALSTLEKEIVTTADLARARTLRRMLRDLWQHVTDVTDRAANKEDELVERLR